MAVESRLPWADVGPGEARALDIAISESYASREIRIPVFVRRGRADGPTLAITAAVHGDEINGVGAIRELIGAPPFDVVAGTLVLVPVVAMPGFERHSRLSARSARPEPLFSRIRRGQPRAAIGAGGV